MSAFSASITPDLPERSPSGARIFAVMLLALVLAVTGVWGPFADLVDRVLIAAAGSMTVVAVVLGVWGHRVSAAHSMARDMLAGFIEKDVSPSFVTDDEGLILTRNSAARVRFSDDQADTLAATLRSIFANPSAVLFRLQSRARMDGNAAEDIVTRRGHIRLRVHSLADGGLLWRVEEVSDRSGWGSGGDTCHVPMLTVGRSGAVLFMNEAARKMVGERVKSLDRLFVSTPVEPGQVQDITTSTGIVSVVVGEHGTSPVRRELYLMTVRNLDRPEREEGFNTLPVPMLKIAAHGEVREANRLASELLGNAVAGGMHISEFMQGLGRPIEDWLRDVAEGVAVQKSEFLRLSRKDKEVYVQVTLSRTSENGNTGLIAVLNDATELKTLEAQFVQSQKMQAIGQLAGGVAHDFNNLLTAISGHCDLLLLRHDQGDQDYGDLVQINQNANRAAALVGQLLAFSRKQTLRPETLDFRDTLSDLTHLLNRLVGEKVTLTLSHDPVLKPVRADKRQLEQVLMNLVVNARDAMPQGGEIRIETEVVHLDNALERDRATLPPGEYVTVKVRDEGIGIAPDKIQNVFEPFYTTKRTGEGTGLGLSTAYGIIKQTGGYIFVDSVEGQGTEFIIYFPVHDQSERIETQPKEDQKNPAARHGEGVVLLVEDEAPVRAFASRALRLRGYTVLEAESAEDALKTLKDPDLSVDVFVTDVVMPGLDGPTWVREALKERPQVRVVFVSGYAEGAFGDCDPDIPNSVFLPKPFSLNQLTETVHQQLH
ncbi:hybrid sensor histidine kinase/response regulator [Falsiruegeria mediterranea]|uniref:histidine kinase n=1 Tax=Falsiruegeria mediterranea M17 TaxID=1200281 RepID=A0A2R8C8E4_9RHOB|nr:ATP-binding protein [Falsiruegeria mediterranea]SPJ28672.1 Sensor kinase CckA [Falsiruegeria mediterranea M17]